MRRSLQVLAVTVALVAGLISPATAAHHHIRVERVTAHFTAATDTPVLPSTPRGVVTLTQRGAKPYGLDPLTVAVHVIGLAPNTAYVTVPYTDPVCAPDPGGTAFPSNSFVADANGAAYVTRAVNPRAINPAGRLNAAQVRSFSIRSVLAQSQPLPVPVLPPVTLPSLPIVGPVQPPTATPTVPLVVPEACDGHPVVKRLH